MQEAIERILLQTDNNETVKTVQKLARMVGARADRLSSTTSHSSSISSDARQEVTWVE